MGDAYERYKARRSQPSAAESGGDDGGGFSLLESIGNIPGGLASFGEGILGLGVNVVKDAGSAIGHGVETALDFGGDRGEAIANRYNFTTDDLVKGLAFDWETDDKPLNERILPMLQGITEPYGFNPLKGDFKPDKEMALEHLESDPVAVILDAIAVATLGGSAAATGAKGASRVTSVADDLVRGTNMSRTARAVEKVLPGAPDIARARRAGVVSDVPWGGTERVLSQTGRVREFDMPTNPTRRLFKEAKLKFKTSPAEETLAAKLDELDSQLVNAGTDTPVTNLRTMRDQTQATLNRARAQRVERIQKDSYYKKYTSKMHRKIIAENGSEFISDRATRTQDHLEPLRSLGPEDNIDLDLKLQAVPGYETKGGHVPYEQLRTLIDEAPEEMAGLAEQLKPVAELVDRAAAKVDDVDAVHASPLGQQVYERYLNQLKANTDIDDRYMQMRRPGVGYRQAMTPEEVAGLDEAAKRAAVYEAEAGKAFLEVLGEPAAGQVSELGTAIDKMRLANLRGEALGMVQSGTSFTELIDRLFEPQRVKIWHDQGLNSLDDVPETGLDIYKRFREEGLKAPAYFPHYETLKHSRGKHLQPSKKLRGMGVASDINNLKRSKGSLMKEFYEGTRDAYVRDPAEAYARLSAEFAGQKATLKLITRIKHEDGIPMSALDEAPPGYVFINPDGLQQLIRRDSEVRMRGARALMDGADPQSAWAKAIEETFFDPEKAKASRAEIYAVPQIVADELQSAASIRLGKMEPHVRVWVDGPTNVWRTANLYTRPGFYINNIGGNTTFLKLQGAKLRNLISQWDKKYQANFNQMVKEFGEKTGTDVDAAITGGMFEAAAFRSPHMGSALDADGLTGKTARGVDRVQRSKAGKGATWTVAQGQRLNGAFEDWARRESFMTALEKETVKRGVKKTGNKFIRDTKRVEQLWKMGLEDPRLITKAVDGMNDTMNNYRALGPAERKIVRRFVMPFFPFYKHALRTLVRLPIDHPGKAQLLESVSEMDGEITGQVVGFLEQAWEMGPGRVAGAISYLAPDAINVFGGITGENPITQIAPIPKMIFETLLGQDLYTGKEFSSPEVGSAFGSDKTYRMGPDGEPEETTVRPLLGTEGIGGALNYIGNQFGPYKLMRDLTTGGSRYSTGEVREDPAGNPQYPDSNLTQFMRYLGIPMYDINAASYEAQEQRDKQSALEALLRGQ